MGYFDKTLFQSYNSKEKTILENELRFPNRFFDWEPPNHLYYCNSYSSRMNLSYSLIFRGGVTYVSMNKAFFRLIFTNTCNYFVINM